jgi:hypothetical protein
MKAFFTNSNSHMALILGRPRTINASDCTIKTPIDCNFPTDPSKTVPTTTSEDEAPSSYSPHLFHYALGQKVHEMLSLGANKRHLKDYDIVKALHDQVVSLLNAVPPGIRPENPDVSWDSKRPDLPKKRQHILGAATSFLMALHRPHVAAHSESRQAAVQAALDCLEAQQRLFELVSRHHYKIYTLSFYTIDAAVFLSSIIIVDPRVDQHLLEQINRALLQAIDRLELMKERSPMAKSGALILTTCFQKIQQSSYQKVLKMQESTRTKTGFVNHGDPAVREPQRPCVNLINDTVKALHEAQNLGDDWAPGVNGWEPTSKSRTDPSTNSGVFNETDSDISFWMDQMGQDVNFDPGLSINDSVWSSLLG